MTARASPRTWRTLLPLACVTLAACSTLGNGRIERLDSTDAQALLVPGRTTEADARATFGDGVVIRFESGWQTWQYVDRQGMAKGWDQVPYLNLIAARMAGEEKELVLLFDPAGVLRRWSLQVNPPERTLHHPG